jgi:hypothetical protein
MISKDKMKQLLDKEINYHYKMALQYKVKKKSRMSTVHQCKMNGLKDFKNVIDHEENKTV